MSTKASERRRAYGLKRIVVSQHNYEQLKRLGQAGDSFNDVITNLLLIQRNYQKEKEKKRQQVQRQGNNNNEDNDSNISNVINELYPQNFIEEAVEQQRQEMDEIFRAIEETKR